MKERKKKQTKKSTVYVLYWKTKKQKTREREV